MPYCLGGQNTLIPAHQDDKERSELVKGAHW